MHEVPIKHTLFMISVVNILHYNTHPKNNSTEEVIEKKTVQVVVKKSSNL